VAQPQQEVIPAEEPAAGAEVVANDEVVVSETQVVIRPASEVTPSPAPSAEAIAQQQSEVAMRNVLSINTVKLLSRTSVASANSVSGNGSFGTVNIAGNSGLNAILSYDLSTTNGVTGAWISFDVAGNTFVAGSDRSIAEKIVNSDGSVTLMYIATDLLVGDTSGKYGYLAIGDSHISRSAIKVSLTLGADGSVLGSAISLIPKS
jgi:hypothetical protein